MCTRYVFTHTCHHTGHGPILRCSQTSISPQQPPHKPIEIHLHLHLPCPFCTTPALSCAAGAGAFTILTINPQPCWIIIKTCFLEELKPSDWTRGYENGNWRQMAWIPRPGGLVRELDVAELEMMGLGGLGGLWEWEGSERMVRVESRWRVRNGQPVRSRLPGILSRLGKRVALDRER